MSKTKEIVKTHPFVMLFLLISTMIITLAEISLIQGALTNPLWKPFAISTGILNIILIAYTIYAYKRY